ncbi:hypothetical protein NZD85_11625 [Empedobacter stercoris]|uniref:hypothetical protein n=1 Tax=Empedobacter stercoris TaxID=1628248 RepID=UPI0021B08D8D|nr:hypothetical protein [Empedobacter stercoris]UWX66525.1 hypothetical protein NZD85_11625 [Empedobacter stercoris]
MKNIKFLIAKYYFFGLIFLTIFYFIIGEIPRIYTIERDWKEWTATIIGIPIIGILVSNYLNKKIENGSKKYYGISFIALFFSWILILYFKALIVGIISSFEFGEAKILDSIIGYSIYQLWFYAIFGIIYGIFAGYFLSKDLKKI